MTDQERVDLEERIIGMVQENPRISTCDIAYRTAALRSKVQRILSNEGLHSYHLLNIQHLLHKNYGCQEEFSQWIIGQHNLNRFIR